MESCRHNKKCNQLGFLAPALIAALVMVTATGCGGSAVGRDGSQSSPAVVRYTVSLDGEQVVIIESDSGALFEESGIDASSLDDGMREALEDGVAVDSLADARLLVEAYGKLASGAAQEASTEPCYLGLDGNRVALYAHQNGADPEELGSLTLSDTVADERWMRMALVDRVHVESFESARELAGDFDALHRYLLSDISVARSATRDLQTRLFDGSPYFISTADSNYGFEDLAVFSTETGRPFYYSNEAVDDLGPTAFEAVWQGIPADSLMEAFSIVRELVREAEQNSEPDEWETAEPTPPIGVYQGAMEVKDARGEITEVGLAFVFDVNTSVNDEAVQVSCWVGGDFYDADGRYGMTGTIDYETGKISLRGVEWDERGSLDTMMRFDGIIDFDSHSMSGTCEALDGSSSGKWLLVQFVSP